MSNSQGAVDSMTVLERWIQGSVILFVTVVAKVVGAKAAVQSCGAAVLALPINLVGTMLVALGCPCTDLFE